MDNADPGSDLIVDPERATFLETHTEHGTNIFVRAKLGGHWSAHDIAALDATSLLAWLRAHGGNNPRAENVIAILLGHTSTIFEVDHG